MGLLNFAFLTYLGGHWTIVIACVLGVVLLGGLSFMLRNWQFAALAIALAVIGFLYQGAVTDGIKLQMAKDAIAQTNFLREQIETLNAANDLDAQRAKDDKTIISQLEEQVRATPKNDASCLDANSARRLRNIR
jgi:hypothetical protein